MAVPWKLPFSVILSSSVIRNDNDDDGDDDDDDNYDDGDDDDVVDDEEEEEEDEKKEDVGDDDNDNDDDSDGDGGGGGGDDKDDEDDYDLTLFRATHNFPIIPCHHSLSVLSRLILLDLLLYRRFYSGTYDFRFFEVMTSISLINGQEVLEKSDFQVGVLESIRGVFCIKCHGPL